VALRRRPVAPELVASNEQRQEQPVSAVKPQTSAGDVPNRQESIKTSQPPTVSQTPVPAGVASTTDTLPKVATAKLPETKTIVPSKEIAAAETDPMKKAETGVPVQQPSYAPAPPGQSQSG